MTNGYTDATSPAPGLRIINLRAAIADVHANGVQVHGADAIGLGLHSNGMLGADILSVPPDTAFPVHTHPGDHLLLCLEGTGTISVDGITYKVTPGDLYMVDGMIPHAVGAGPGGHVLVAIGSPHKPIDSPERMTFTDWDGTPTDAPLFHPGSTEAGTGAATGVRDGT